MLTRTECNLLRGIAIIGIVLHNYCHWLSVAVQENEYQFFLQNVSGINHAIFSPDSLLPVHLLSFFGHYGVPVFLFLSAYGLTLKYERSVPDYSSQPSIWQFVRYHFIKLFRMMIVGYVAFTMVDYVTPAPYHYTFGNIVGQLLMVSNVFSQPDHAIWPGPYWFFGLMLQLYIIYRLLLYRRSWMITALLMAVFTGLQLLMQPDGDAINSYRYNFMGGMLPFGAGILYARYWKRQAGLATEATVFLASTLLVYLTSLSFVTWALTPIFVCAASISLVRTVNIASMLNLPLLSWLSKGVVWCLNFVGGISAALFVCHPITRKIFIPISRQGDVYAGLLLYIVSSLCVAWLFSQFLKRIPKPKL